MTLTSFRSRNIDDGHAIILLIVTPLECQAVQTWGIGRIVGTGAKCG